MNHQPERKTYYGRWTPEPRPDWVATLNHEGQFLDIRAIVPLDEASLLDWARSNTGLEDFGDDEWVEPFRIFIKSLDEEANLNLMGRIWVRMEILNLLEARLQIEDAFRRNPEIAEEVIEKPIVIIGQGRSGTTALFNLLAADPRIGVIRQWESMYPCPAPEAATYRTDPRIQKAHDITMMQERITPEFAGMHIIGGDAPRECGRVQALTFQTMWLNVIGQCPTYARYLAGRDTTASYRYQKRFMQLMQWKNPRQRWVIKNPVHLDRLPELLSVFPDAGIVWPHRDPLRALASGTSMAGTWQWQRSDLPFNHPDSWGFITDPSITAGRFDRVMKWLDEGTVPRDQFLNIYYKDFVNDRMKTVEQIYETFDFPFPDDVRAVIQDYIDQHPRDKRQAHRYSVGSDEDVAKSRKAFGRYLAYFDVPKE